VLLLRSGELPGSGFVKRDPVLYHEKRSEIFLFPFLNFLWWRFSRKPYHETRSWEFLLFSGVTCVSNSWSAIHFNWIDFQNTDSNFCCHIYISLALPVQNFFYKTLVRYCECQTLFKLLTNNL